MGKDPDYYSINEVDKPQDKRVYHDNNKCTAGEKIPKNEQKLGKGPAGVTYRHCDDCDR